MAVESDLSVEESVGATEVKICGLTRRKDALHAAEAGADYLGVVLVPRTPRYRTPQQAKAITTDLPATAVIVVSNLELPELAHSATTAGAGIIQMHGEETPELVGRIREEGPWEVWKALRIREPADFAEGLDRYGSVVDGLLLDGWHPSKQGGAGVSFSWAEAGETRGRVPKGLTLAVAGGLNPENVGKAVTLLHPDVVDVSSGVEAEVGKKDPSKVEAFVRNVRAQNPGETR